MGEELYIQVEGEEVEVAVSQVEEGVESLDAAAGMYKRTVQLLENQKVRSARPGAAQAGPGLEKAL